MCCRLCQRQIQTKTIDDPRNLGAIVRTQTQGLLEIPAGPPVLTGQGIGQAATEIDLVLLRLATGRGPLGMEMLSLEPNPIQFHTAAGL